MPSCSECLAKIAQLKAILRFGEICCCSCLPLLLGLACSIHATWGSPFSQASKCRRLYHLRNLATDWHWSSRVGRQFRHKGKLIVERRKLAANLPTEVVCWCISDSLWTMDCIFTLSASSQIFKTHKGWHSYGSSYQKGFYTALSSKRRIAWSYWIPGLSLSFSSLSNTTYIWPLPFLCDNVVGKVWPRCLLVFCTCAVSPWNCERRDSSRRMNKPLLIIQGSKQPNVLPFLSWSIFANKMVVKIKVLFLESDREFQVQDGDGSRPPVAAAARRMYA